MNSARFAAVAATLSGCFALLTGCSGSSSNPPPPPKPRGIVIANGPLKGAEVLNLVNGANAIDFDNDGNRDIVMVGWRENFNAHDYVSYEFFRNSPADSVDGHQWQVVPFESKEDPVLRDDFQSTGGADCLLSRIHIFRPAAAADSAIAVVTGIRDFGNNYADSAKVTFREFRLATNSGSAAGWPSRYFNVVSVTRSNGKYCDVDDAFASERGIPRPTAPR